MIFLVFLSIFKNMKKKKRPLKTVKLKFSSKEKNYIVLVNDCRLNIHLQHDLLPFSNDLKILYRTGQYSLPQKRPNKCHSKWRKHLRSTHEPMTISLGGFLLRISGAFNQFWPEYNNVVEDYFASLIPFIMLIFVSEWKRAGLLSV